MNKSTRIYKFYDTDDLGMGEYDVAGADYVKLIEACCKHCTFFSLVITNPDSAILEKLQPFEISKSDVIKFEFDHYEKSSVTVKYYKVSSALCKTILSQTNSIFCWINGWGFSNPEDPTFYRDDGSVFFTSTIHEGECTLMVQDEDVFDIVSDERWVSVM